MKTSLSDHHHEPNTTLPPLWFLILFLVLECPWGPISWTARRGLSNSQAQGLCRKHEAFLCRELFDHLQRRRPKCARGYTVVCGVLGGRLEKKPSAWLRSTIHCRETRISRITTNENSDDYEIPLTFTPESFLMLSIIRLDFRLSRSV